MTCAKKAEARAKALSLTIDFRQSNNEGELVTWVQEARDKAQAIIINAGAYSHTSIALLDALQAAELPVIEVHLSNIFRREPYRQHSYISLGAKGVICGLGAKGYELALEAIADMLATVAPWLRTQRAESKAAQEGKAKHDGQGSGRQRSATSSD